MSQLSNTPIRLISVGKRVFITYSEPVCKLEESAPSCRMIHQCLPSAGIHVQGTSAQWYLMAYSWGNVSQPLVLIVTPRACSLRSIFEICFVMATMGALVPGYGSVHCHPHCCLWHAALAGTSSDAFQVSLTCRQARSQVWYV